MAILGDSGLIGKRGPGQRGESTDVPNSEVDEFVSAFRATDVPNSEVDEFVSAFRAIEYAFLAGVKDGAETLAQVTILDRHGVTKATISYPLSREKAVRAALGEIAQHHSGMVLNIDPKAPRHERRDTRSKLPRPGSLAEHFKVLRAMRVNRVIRDEVTGDEIVEEKFVRPLELAIRATDRAIAALDRTSDKIAALQADVAQALSPSGETKQ